MAGKGSKPRPSSVDQMTFDQNWDRIFGRKDTTQWDHYSDLPAVGSYDIPVLENEEMWSQRIIDECRSDGDKGC
jgi:hypothetical protein